MAQDKRYLCPLCQAEIPADSSKCPYCGALFVAGSHPFILKGIECPNCGHRNYSYDYCAECKKPFSVACPMCGERMNLSSERCPNCGLKREKFNLVRELGPEKFKRRRLMNWLMLGAATGLVAIVVAAFMITSSKPAVSEPKEEEFVNPRMVDADGDGKPERIEHFDDARRLVKLEEDTDGDGRMDKISWFEPDTQRPVRIERTGETAGTKVVELYDENGIIRTRFVIYAKEPERVKIEERFTKDGRLSEHWEDRDGDGAFDSYRKLRPDGSVWIEAEDVSGEGFIDTWKFYNAAGVLIKEGRDADGDGILDEIRTYNSDGKLVSEEFDKNADGFPDEAVYFNYLGNVRWKEFDKDGDGLFEYFESYTKRGTFARRGYDTNGDGKIDRWE